MPGRRECAEGGGRLEKEGPRGNNYRLGDEKKKWIGLQRRAD